MNSNSTPIIKLMCHWISQYLLCYQTLFPSPQRQTKKVVNMRLLKTYHALIVIAHSTVIMVCTYKHFLSDNFKLTVGL